MASYRPSSELQLVKSCDESWEEMAGDSRKRHCGSCQCDVLNVAAMTPAELEVVIAGPGPLPCLRVARYEDGSLLVATDQRRVSWWGRVTGAAAGLLMTAGAMAQGVRPTAPEQSGLVQGSVVDSAGKGVAHSSVQLFDGKVSVSTETDSAGAFVFHVRAGEYKVLVYARGFANVSGQAVQVHMEASSLLAPITLREVQGMPMSQGAFIPVPKPGQVAVKVNLGVRPAVPKR